ncbi:flagellar biosynthesis protein FlhF [Sulfurirhabdus autotrophica]|uniref:Flagellar biosynthesis protein FlhF n=1 Tax=Sulfurirhabdus autotrophica TaxID=1706046 RepID=A0A4R3YFI8_9PROT|nr:flagellar biosynthesis protein FlhF [Sulfurirhabdus autotrophica]TCV90741.1 flagellar biosynthesis protein FlhF [Sulfurirhabdus autotrophica]
MIKKFHASTTREALRQVRDALGPNAIILSNRQVGGGVEIMAVADMDVASLSNHPGMASPASGIQMPLNPAPQSVQHEIFAEHIRPTVSPTPARAPVSNQQPAPEPTPSPATPAADKNQEVNSEIVKEIRFLRGMLEGQLAGLAWSDLQRREPAKVEILRQMLTVGFSPTLSRQLLDNMPAGYDFDKGLKWIKTALVHNLHAVGSGQDIIEKGGIYALVGPTGVGKTTTVAKLAARCTLRHGPNSLALITTDSYRIGAHDQLRIYGRILGVPVYAVKDEADLQLTLADLQNRHLVLIDTVGMSQRDRRLAQQISLLCGKGRDVKRLLLVSATSQGNTLEDVVRAYQGEGMAGCILTKVDEALSLGSALDVVTRHKLTLHFVTNGQRVPEDLHLANPLYLIDRALKAGKDDSPFSMNELDCPLVMAGGANATEEKPGFARDTGKSGEGAYRG